MQFTRARLTTFDDPQYRAFVRSMTMSRDNQRATRPPRQRDLFGGEVENLLREWLVAQNLVLSERRILEYEERRGRSSIRKYRELDALVESGKTLHIFEIKASRAARAVSRAYAQLHDIRGALRLITPHIVTTILLVDTGIPTSAAVAELMRSADAPYSPPLTLDNVFSEGARVKLVHSLDQIQPSDDQISVLRFSVDDIIALAGGRPLHLDWAADDDDEPPPAPPPSIHTIGNDADDDENDSPFAALRGSFKE